MSTFAVMQHVEALVNHKDTVHDQLANVYLSLSRPLSEETRTESLTILNDAMTSLRRMDDTLSFIKIDAMNVSNGIDRLAVALQELKL